LGETDVVGRLSWRERVRLLLVEDDPKISRFLLKGLREDQHVVDLAEDGPSGLDQAGAVDYDAVLLDLMLPGLDGFEVCRQMRSQRIAAPILIISARNAVRDRVHVLDCGADDYLVKPFAFEELLARLRALNRRGRNRQTARTIGYGPIAIDPVDHLVTINSQTLSLTATEYRLLEYLVRRSESIVTRDQLAEYVWGGDYDPISNVADVYVGYVRRKLYAALPRPLIHTVRGLGYMLKQTPSAS
jgi:DNA-binding response OmpR family regulator